MMMMMMIIIKLNVSIERKIQETAIVYNFKLIYYYNDSNYTPNLFKDDSVYVLKLFLSTDNVKMVTSPNTTDIVVSPPTEPLDPPPTELHKIDSVMEDILSQASSFRDILTDKSRQLSNCYKADTSLPSIITMSPYF